MSEQHSNEHNKQQQHICSFEERLRQCPRNPWTMISGSQIHTPDARVIRLHQVIAGRGWCEETTYLDFLDRRIHRQLLDGFVIDAHKPQWHIDELLKRIGPRISRMTLETALRFCEIQGFVVATKNRSWWSRGPQLRQIHNMGATFEWLVQALLQHPYRAVARRDVILKELPPYEFGDIDILAFTENGLTVTIECKSHSSRITNGHIERFIKRASAFPADIALLLIDTDNAQALHNRLPQINTILGHAWEHRHLARHMQGERALYHLQDNLYLGNTAGGVAATLGDVLGLKRNKRKRRP